MAIAALTCGLAEFFTLGLTAIPAIVLGHAARRQMRRTGQPGDGLALTGLILGWAGIGLLITVFALITVVSTHSGHPIVVKPDIFKPAPGGFGGPQG
jgi:uncharacterized protein DUF4190